ncbi:uncharacterized protein PG986_008911 [Apiospora aurea]|uniref:Uncharacterized protein n=1 Tax=Apiospora aurea TaxID=335848 RepID=A0ABR1Q6G3_9PEZI
MPGAPVEAPAANHPRLTAEAQTLESLSYCNLSKAKKEAAGCYSARTKSRRQNPPKKHFAVPSSRPSWFPSRNGSSLTLFRIQQVHSAGQRRLDQVQRPTSFLI